MSRPGFDIKPWHQWTATLAGGSPPPRPRRLSVPAILLAVVVGTIAIIALGALAAPYLMETP